MTVSAVVDQVWVEVVLMLFAAEVFDVIGWVSRKLVGWSARLRYTSRQRADVRAEELSALINDRPTQILKLLTALGFLVVAIGAAGARKARKLPALSVSTILRLKAFLARLRQPVSLAATAGTFVKMTFPVALVLALAELASWLFMLPSLALFAVQGLRSLAPKKDDSAKR